MTTGIIVTPSVEKKTDIDCGNGLSDVDICHITCDFNDPRVPNLYCGNAGQCIIDCTVASCLYQTNIYASATNNLTLTSTVKGCIEGANVYLPDNGNATIIGDGSHSALAYSFIHSGTSTDHIHVICDPESDSRMWSCNKMDIDATTAQHLDIALNGAFFLGSIVKCPINSTLTPSCIIDANSALSTSNLQISAPKGMPQGVIFYSLGDGDYSGTTITCSAGTSTIVGDTFIDTPCYIPIGTIATTSPTSTTSNPTLYPLLSSSNTVSPTSSSSPPPPSNSAAATLPPLVSTTPTSVTSVSTTNDRSESTIKVSSTRLMSSSGLSSTYPISPIHDTEPMTSDVYTTVFARNDGYMTKDGMMNKLIPVAIIIFVVNALCGFFIYKWYKRKQLEKRKDKVNDLPAEIPDLPPAEDIYDADRGQNLEKVSSISMETMNTRNPNGEIIYITERGEKDHITKSEKRIPMNERKPNNDLEESCSSEKMYDVQPETKDTTMHDGNQGTTDTGQIEGGI